MTAPSRRQRRPQDGLVIASRGSPLALQQSRHVAQLIEQQLGTTCQVKTISTQADQWVDTPIVNFGGKGIFVKELEQALFAGEADLAVHSLKDVPTVLPQGLGIPAILEREDSQDALVLNKKRHPQPSDLKPITLAQMAEDLRIAAGSLRRKNQLRVHRPKWLLQDMRGNLGTRVFRMHERELDGMVLARAGLDRLYHAKDHHAMFEDIWYFNLSPQDMLPCPGQGALCIECLTDDRDLYSLLERLNHAPSALCVELERKLSQAFNADCHAPFAAHCQILDQTISLSASVVDHQGRVAFAEHAIPYVAQEAQTHNLVRQVCDSLTNLGAREILTSQLQATEH